MHFKFLGITFLWFADCSVWNLTGILGHNGNWFFGFSINKSVTNSANWIHEQLNNSTNNVKYKVSQHYKQVYQEAVNSQTIKNQDFINLLQIFTLYNLIITYNSLELYNTGSSVIIKIMPGDDISESIFHLLIKQFKQINKDFCLRTDFQVEEHEDIWVENEKGFTKRLPYKVFTLSIKTENADDKSLFIKSLSTIHKTLK